MGPPLRQSLWHKVFRWCKASSYQLILSISGACLIQIWKDSNDLLKLGPSGPPSLWVLGAVPHFAVKLVMGQDMFLDTDLQVFLLSWDRFVFELLYRTGSYFSGLKTTFTCTYGAALEQFLVSVIISFLHRGRSWQKSILNFNQS